MKISRWQLFEAIDQPALKPLPQDRYQYAAWCKDKINVDYHFACEDHYYSVPYKYISQKVEIRITEKTIEITLNVIPLTI